MNQNDIFKKACENPNEFILTLKKAGKFCDWYLKKIKKLTIKKTPLKKDK